MSEPLIRAASVADAPVLAQMEESCFSCPRDLSSFTSILANPAALFLIAEIDGRPVGYSGMTVVIDECDIINIAVTEPYRRRGIGRALVEAVLDMCKKRGVEKVFLEHRRSNDPAARLYESFGFAVYGERRRYYTAPVEDAVLRVLEL